VGGPGKAWSRRMRTPRAQGSFTFKVAVPWKNAEPAT
jgi:hypothetical protein